MKIGSEYAVEKEVRFFARPMSILDYAGIARGFRHVVWLTMRTSTRMRPTGRCIQPTLLGRGLKPLRRAHCRST